MKTPLGNVFAPLIDSSRLREEICKVQDTDKRAWLILKAVELRKNGHSETTIQNCLGKVHPKLTPRRRRKIKRIKKYFEGINVPASYLQELQDGYSGPSIGTINRWLAAAHKFNTKELVEFAVDKRRKK